LLSCFVLQEIFASSSFFVTKRVWEKERQEDRMDMPFFSNAIIEKFCCTERLNSKGRL
jgi:hypothetical protein